MNIVKKHISRILKLSIALLVGLLNIADAQVILSTKQIVCPNEPTELRINDKALNQLEFCVSRIGQRNNLYYFRTCKQVTIYDAILMSKVMKGFLATANDEATNNYLFTLLPNDIHWLGLIQNPKAKNFNDPPDPASGFEWMSKEIYTRPSWVPGEPNNLENVNPGRYIIQGCRRNSSWCDENDEKKYVGIIESKSPLIPVLNAPQIAWETGETTQSIVVKPTKSKYYKVRIIYDTHAIEDSILIETPEANVKLTKPGGCNPYKWKPELITNVPVNSLNIEWEFGSDIKINELLPDFTTNSDGFITGTVKVLSTECSVELLKESEVFELYPMKTQLKIDSLVKLNDEILIIPKNEGPYTYKWTPAFGLNKTAEFSPFFKATKDVNYILTIKDDFGCSVTEEFGYAIDKKLSIFVPTAFTPNNDGINDDFEIKTIKGFYGNIYKIVIYNNLGESVFVKSGSDLKWNGSVNGKVPVKGLYSYKIYYTIGDIKYYQLGSVILLR